MGYTNNSLVNSKAVRNIFSKIPIVFLFPVFTFCACLQNVQGVEASDGTNCPIVKVCDSIYRGPRLSDLNELKIRKIHTILNLENDTEAVSREEAVAKGLGIEIIKLPMSGIERPKAADLKKAVEIMEDPKLQPVYVHCLHGRDRTGLVVAAYRILHDGWTMDRAYREVIENGHTWWLYDLILRWKKSLRELSIQNPVKKAPAQNLLPTPVPAAS